MRRDTQFAFFACPACGTGERPMGLSSNRSIIPWSSLCCKANVSRMLTELQLHFLRLAQILQFMGIRPIPLPGSQEPAPGSRRFLLPQQVACRPVPRRVFPTRLAPCGGPVHSNLLGRSESARHQGFAPRGKPLVRRWRGGSPAARRSPRRLSRLRSLRDGR